MTEKNSDVISAPQIKDKRIIPPGVIPKNLQGWAFGGLAALMMIVIVFSNTNTPKIHVDPPPPPSIAETNAARIKEYEKRIEEQTRKLKLEQADLARTQESNFTNIGVSGATPPLSDVRNDAEIYRDTYGRGYSNGERIPPDTGLRAEKEKREYQSLFASNVALSLREPAASAPTPAASPAQDELTKFLSLNAALASLPMGVSAANGPTTPVPLAVTSSKSADGIQRLEPATLERSRDSEVARTKSSVPDGIAVESPGTYRVYEGTVLETALTNRLDGAFSGPVNCMVTTDLYSRDGRHLLVPQGSRVLGEVQKVDSFGQERLAVFFHRLVMPDGYSVSLDQFQGLNQIGETGLRDRVNRHYLQVFGVSLAIGAIAGLGQANVGTGTDRSVLDNYEQGVTTSLSQSSLHILDRYLNILPTFTVREGLRVKIYLSQDLLLPAYDKHQHGNP